MTFSVSCLPEVSGSVFSPLAITVSSFEPRRVSEPEMSDITLEIKMVVQMLWRR